MKILHAQKAWAVVIVESMEIPSAVSESNAKENNINENAPALMNL